MSDSYEKERIAQLEAKVYFEEGLSPDEEAELAHLIQQINRRLDKPTGSME